mmetsp:Transcript_21525/g.31517  ORF Transcript_21525/g.31517 Transcript_21525/m.31517 type:complete len:355 (+) Transcript_21525:297-1361(+)
MSTLLQMKAGPEPFRRKRERAGGIQHDAQRRRLRLETEELFVEAPVLWLRVAGVDHALRQLVGRDELVDAGPHEAAHHGEQEPYHLKPVVHPREGVVKGGGCEAAALPSALNDLAQFGLLPRLLAANQVDDDVEAVLVPHKLRQVPPLLGGVVHRAVGPELQDQPRLAGGGRHERGARRLGELHHKAPDAPGPAQHQHPVPGAHVRFHHCLRRDGARAERRGLEEGEPFGLVRGQRLLDHAVLGQATQRVGFDERGVHPVSDRKAVMLGALFGADRDNDAAAVPAWDVGEVFGLLHQPRVAALHARVPRGQRDGVHAQQQLAGARSRHWPILFHGDRIVQGAVAADADAPHRQR